MPPHMVIRDNWIQTLHPTWKKDRPVQTERNRELISRHMPGLDYLRGIAVTTVVLYHGFYWSAPGYLSQ